MKNFFLILVAFAACSSVQAELLSHFLDGQESPYNHAATVPGIDSSGGSQMTTYEGAITSFTYSRNQDKISFPTVSGGSGNYWALFNDHTTPSDTPHYDKSYIQFSTKAEEGKSLDLYNITFDWGAAVLEPTTVTSRFGFEIFANIGGEDWIHLGLTSQRGIINVGTDAGFKTFDQSVSFDLTSWSQTYSNINEVTFRIAFANTTEDGEESLAISNIRLNGMVRDAIPEPSTSMLGLLAFIGCLVRRKVRPA